MSGRRLAPVAVVAAVAAAAAVVGVTWAAFSSSSSNPPSSFSAAGSFCTRSSAVWLTGMEHGVVSTVGGAIFSAVTGAPTADSATFRNGDYSLRIADTSASSTINARRAFTASVTVVRFAVRLAALPAVNSNLAYVDSGTDLVLGYSSATQRLTLTAGTSTASSAATVSAGAWYVIDLRYDLSANPNVAAWRVNGVVQTGLSRAAAATTAAGFGLGATANASVYTANFDDIFVADQSTAYPLGDGRIVRLVPDSAGTHSGAANFRNDDGSAINATSWQRLDDVPMTSTADYVRQQANSGTSYVELGFGDTGETCIRELSAVLAYHAATNAANNGKASVFDGTAESVVHSGDMSSTAIQYASAILVPAGPRWTQSSVNGLVARVGYSTDSNPNPYWDAIVIEAAVA
jgi:hypothetical protein